MGRIALENVVTDILTASKRLTLIDERANFLRPIEDSVFTISPIAQDVKVCTVPF